MNYHELLKKVEDHVNLFYLEHADENMFYHNQAHMKEVLDKTKKIADHYQLEDRQFFIVCAAACFHDTAYCIRGIEFHEQKSAELADAFLRSVGADEEDIAAVKKCIMATQMPQAPSTINEKIICDADLYNLGTEDFRQKNRLLRNEAEALSNSKIDGIAWRASTINLLETHTYHTDYCQLLLTKTKEENLAKLKDRQEKKINKLQANTLVQNGGDANKEDSETGVEAARPALPRKKDRPIKGIETMFRISSANSLRMSVMADNKAHIMISVNSIIISVVLGLIVKSLDEHRNLMIPTIILLGVNVATIIYSVLATRPRVAGGTFTQQQVDNKSVNLLFFGSFFNMGFQEYDEGMKRMMADSEFLYGSLTKDIFWQGKVLGRKYSLLRTSYTIFLYGIITAVIAFSVAVAFF
jgi:predicted metal-dependent HD superfamily phosphohydrolase